ncbi:gp53-like domain-containing protein, partial [Enterobacter asburiae]|uniref:gp53-like domain-containing protein n=5 Tax=Enterobacteriaceae TaxID=543 RepID=UPI003BB889C0
LGLGTAAQRNVGTGANQIPDMNSFTSGSGWCRYPDGTIFQYGTVGFGVGVNNQFVTLPRAFTTTSYRVVCTWNDIGTSQSGSSAQAPADIAIGQNTKSINQFGLWQGGGGGFNVDYIAIGK